MCELFSRWLNIDAWRATVCTQYLIYLLCIHTQTYTNSSQVPTQITHTDNHTLLSAAQISKNSKHKCPQFQRKGQLAVWSLRGHPNITNINVNLVLAHISIVIIFIFMLKSSDCRGLVAITLFINFLHTNYYKSICRHMC